VLTRTAAGFARVPAGAAFVVDLDGHRIEAVHDG
jgi:hypothetical protein